MQRLQRNRSEQSLSIYPGKGKQTQTQEANTGKSGLAQGDGLRPQWMGQPSRPACMSDQLRDKHDEPVRLSTSEARDEGQAGAAVRKIQAIFRGRLVRRKIAVTTVAPGIVHVRLTADADLLTLTGLNDITVHSAAKSIDYLAISNDKFKPHLAGGRKIYRPARMAGNKLKKIMAPHTGRSGGVTAYINGYFYNSGWQGAGHLSKAEQRALPEHAAIGANKIKGFRKMQCIPVDQPYGSSFHRIEFPDGSYVTSGPLLADCNPEGTGIESRFTAKEAAQHRYKLSLATDRPGQLGHAQGHHARSGISMPARLAAALSPELTDDRTAKTNCVRIVVGKNDRLKGERANGFTMLEWSSVMRRLGSFNRQPGVSLNLDGGASVVMGVLDCNGSKLLEIRGTDKIQPTTTSFVAFTPTAQRPHAFSRLADRLKKLWW